jgi:Mn2+/Fe2+ NRAMP family transporter
MAEPTTAAPSKNRSALLGAMFLMATSAIGPGFITQTTTFTARLGAAFAFAILVSILVDIAIQQNVWRVLGVSGLRANELGNKALPGLGWALSVLVVLGGMVFNIGNISGTGLGLQAALGGLDPRIGAAFSAGIAIVIFLLKKAGPIVDRIVVLLGLVMIAMTTWVAITTRPPLAEAALNTVMPSQVDFLTITTLIGGTVGGYITYAGAHRLIDSGTTGPENAHQIGRSSITGILVTAVMRTVLFLAVFGVVATGVTLDPANPAASAFQYALGQVGLVVFGIIFWAAAITSVIGASYTSVSFITTQQTSERTRNLWTVGFIVLGTILYLTLGQAPVTLLIFAGAFNGLILPIGFTVILWVAWRRRDLLHGYVYPKWLLIIGALSWLLTLWLGWMSLSGLARLWA